MRMSLESYNKMNELAGKCFDANAVVDNLAYSLDYHYYNEIAKIVHLRVAHKLPEFADKITDKMLEINVLESYDWEELDIWNRVRYINA